MTIRQELDQLETLRDMFMHEGWAIFKGDFTKQLESVQLVDGITTELQLGRHQGMTEVLRGIVNYEGVVDAVEQQLKAENSHEETI
jgi:DNA topoisomerase VI subunit A